MPSLGNQSVASSFDRLLALPGGGGDGTNLVTLTDGNAATTFGLKLSTTSISVPSTGKIYLDGGSDTYITESSDGIIDFIINGETALRLEGSNISFGANTDGNDIKFFGNASGSYMLWDESEDLLELAIGTQDGTALQINTSDNRTKDIVWDESGTTKGMIRFHNDSSGTDANDRMEIGTSIDLDTLVIKNGLVGIGTASPSFDFDIQGTGDVALRVKSADQSAVLRLDAFSDSHLCQIDFMMANSTKGRIDYDHHATATSQSLMFVVGDQAGYPLKLWGDSSVGINKTSHPLAQCHIIGAATGIAGLTTSPVLRLEQLNDDEAFIRFEGTTNTDQTNSLSTDTSVGSIEGHILVEINGTDKWIAYYAKN